jgi:uncharacterized protein
MTTKIIYHQVKKGVDCPDGLAAAWIAHKAYPEAEIIGCWYQCEESDLPVFESGDRAIIVDFSFPADILQRWSDSGVEILLIDHHKTAMEHLGNVSQFSEHFKGEIKFDMEECGATLTWKHFYPNNPVPTFLKYVKDRDLWQKALPSSDAIHEVVSRLGRSFELYDLLESYDFHAHVLFDDLDQSFNPPSAQFAMLAQLGDVLLAPKRRAIASIADRVAIGPFLGYMDIPIVFLEDRSEDRLTSDVCEELYKNRFPKALFVVCQTSDGTWSLRSNKDHSNGGFDVGALAKSKGGGGHRNASGFK